MKNIMVLPTIESPKYFLTIPSTSESLEFRPFLVKEEKVLMIAQEAGTNQSMISAMKDVIKSCTFGVLDLYSLPMSDIEYILLQIRSKSVGETSEIRFKCDECDEMIDLTIDLSEIEVSKGDEIENKIQLTDDVGITLKAPGLKDAEKAAKSNKQNNDIVQSLASVIESVYDSDNIYPFAQAEPKEIENFIDSLSSEQVIKIKEWVDSIPTLKKEIKFKCSKGKERRKVLSGLADFFA
tara:strand:+ start:1597 stop:2310 length:714 start_codon:yes stop_codon:yes gene_type:complete